MFSRPGIKMCGILYHILSTRGLKFSHTDSARLLNRIQRLSSSYYMNNRINSLSLYANRNPSCISLCAAYSHILSRSDTRQSVQGRQSLKLYEQQRRNFNTESFYRTYCGPNNPLIDFAMTTLESMHDFTGFPWWLTIFVVTFTLRAFVTLPLSIYSRKMIFKYLHLHGTVLKKMAERLNVEVNMARKQFGFDEKEAKYMFSAQMNKLKKDLYIKHNCHPFKATAVIWFQLPIWICLSLSLRNLSGASLLEAGHIHPDMMYGGLLWFSDLTQLDPTSIVPAIAFLLYLANIEMSYLQHLKLSRLQNVLIYILRGFSIIVLCIGCQLPSCVPYYWVVSSGIGLVQNLFLMSPNFKKKFRIPSFPHESKTPYLDLIKHAKIKYLGHTTTEKK